MSKGYEIIAILKPKPGNQDRVEELLNIAAQEVKATEPGTTRYHLQRETKGDAPNFVIFETYADKDALMFHAKSEGLKKLQTAVNGEDLLREPMTVMIVKDVGGFKSKL
ncbi:antibiotic biosynthesis monooxygenase-like protein [Alternaria rosae]|uniref:antibiotic biosynthesis monooxygenase-like protein n=1 Tax=Alternaria rosae TaxID=1187941 RepID=UPI001E8D50E6|nr:antibiotic biosynthesis monooxygenase-like protein [Alternaria rosae]KAH6878597.1 antibiotic biosynthesis monooxygenase-like protein [Alternaria rosae]